MIALPTDFLAAERILSQGGSSTEERCLAVVDAARRLVPLDALYVCRVARATDTLRFAYICDGELYGPGRELPLGEGPTSRVVKTGRPVVIQDEETRGGFPMNPFGESRPSRSAVHWPLWLVAGRDDPPDGVLSVQSYRERAYDREALAAVEWLALRSAAHLGEV